MDIQRLAEAIGIVKKLPDTAVGRAEAAADRAEDAAAVASAHGYGITFANSGMELTEDE